MVAREMESGTLSTRQPSPDNFACRNTQNKKNGNDEKRDKSFGKTISLIRTYFFNILLTIVFLDGGPGSINIPHRTRTLLFIVYPTVNSRDFHMRWDIHLRSSLHQGEVQLLSFCCVGLTGLDSCFKNNIVSGGAA